jgi:hypothetical protein
VNNINQFPVGSLALVSNRCIGLDRKRVWFAYRADSENPQDSGWVFHGPNENDAYSGDPDNYSITSISAFLKDDPSLEKIIYSPIWTCWERYSDIGPWFQVSGFFPDA